MIEDRFKSDMSGLAGGTTNLVDTSRPSGSSGGGSSEPKTSVNIADFIGSGDEDEDQDIAQDVAIAYSKPEEERNWVEKRLIDIYENQDFEEESDIGEVFLDPTGQRVTGYTSEAKIPGLLGAFASMFGGRPMAYTGFGVNPYAPPDTSDNEERRRDTRAAAPSIPAPTVAAAPELTPAETAYFGRGVGARTTFDLTNPEDIKRYLASLYAPTPSPLGREPSAYGLRKKEKRMRGLDIFKPVSIL